MLNPTKKGGGSVCRRMPSTSFKFNGVIVTRLSPKYNDMVYLIKIILEKFAHIAIAFNHRQCQFI